jgi:hypothetical protein
VTSPLALLERAAHERDARAAETFVADRFSSFAGANHKLIALALDHAGEASHRARINTHRSEPEWSKHVPLELLEYRPVVGDAPDFSRTVAEEIEFSPWATQRLDSLRAGDDSAALALLDDLHEIARFAAASADDVSRLRAHMRERGLHAMQAAAFERCRRLLDDETQRRARPTVLEIGAADGELVSALAQTGYDAHGVDVLPSPHPQVLVGNFLTDEPRTRYDVVVATALLEWGSGIDPAVLEDPRHVLSRLRALVVDRGTLVLENVRLPLPFTRDDAERAGFTVREERVVSPTLALGGRGVTLHTR